LPGCVSGGTDSCTTFSFDSLWYAMQTHRHLCSGLSRSAGYVFPPGVVTIDQIILVTEQKGIQEIVLHHLFKGPSLYGDWIFASMTILGRALGAILK
jgi:hypothetical protein